MMLLRPWLLCCWLLLLEQTALARESFTTTTLRTAVRAWCDNSTSAVEQYGHISQWNTSAVTDMSNLFAIDSGFAQYYCSTASTFNANISAWNGKQQAARNVN